MNTKSAILKGMEGKARNKAIVLGSGWLIDVPFEELASSFQELWLVDVYHPPQTVKRASLFTNIRFIQTELTGLANQVYDSVKLYRKSKFKTPVGNLKPASPIDLNSFDYVVSCNILSQLDVILTDYIREYNIYSAEEINGLITTIQSAHVRSLPINKSILISDVEEQFIDGGETMVNSRPLLMVPLSSTDISDTWIWKFDTQRTYNPQYMTYFKVVTLNI
jgi:hypothetical protein